MNIIDKLKGIGKGYAWSFGGFLLGILSLTVAAYLFLWERSGQKVDLEILIDSEENLVEVREQIKDLSIMYKGKDII